MSLVRFISDLHLGHKKIVDFASAHRGNVKTSEEHDEWIVNQWNSVVAKRDQVWVLGDVAFDEEKLCLLDRMAGEKRLILGNHDEFPLAVYQRYFRKIHGFMRFKGFWLSHAPIHPVELRGKVNVHGHVHQNVVQDNRYFSVCVEALNGQPISLDSLRERIWQKERPCELRSE